MQVKVSMRHPPSAFDRPNTTDDRMGALQAAFAHHLDGNGKPAGVFESGSDPIIVGQAAYNGALRHELRRQRLVQRPHPRQRPVRRLRPHPGRSQPTDTFRFNTLALPTQRCKYPSNQRECTTR